MPNYNKIIDILNSIYAVDGNYQPNEIIDAIDVAVKCVKLQQNRKSIVVPKLLERCKKHKKFNIR